MLTHSGGKPPTPELIAELLDLAVDFVRTLVVTLGDEGILRVVENPFEIRVEVADYKKLEDLPRDASGPTMRDELETFIQTKQDEYEATEKMLNPDEMEKKRKDKMSEMEDEMKKMKGPNSSSLD